MFSGLTVDQFMRRTSVVSFSKRALRDSLPSIEAFGKVEGLDAARLASARIRFHEPGRRQVERMSAYVPCEQPKLPVSSSLIPTRIRIHRRRRCWKRCAVLSDT